MSSDFPYRDRVRAELERVVSAEPRRQFRWARYLVPAVGAAAVVAVLVLLSAGDGGDTTGEPSLPTALQPGPLPSVEDAAMPKGSLGSFLGIGPEDFEQISLADANERAVFDPLLPDIPEANLSNLLGVQDGDRLAERKPNPVRVLELDPPEGPGRPIGTLMMEFPPPTSTSDEVRQPFIWLWQEEASAKGTMSIERQIRHGNSAARSCDVDGALALCVDARDPKDEFEANAAYLEFIRGDVRVTVAGGDDLGVLLELARSLEPLPE